MVDDANNLPPLTATEYGRLAAALTCVFVPARPVTQAATDVRCPACSRPHAECRCATWCAECECRTNHTTAQHREAAADAPAEPTR